MNVERLNEIALWLEGGAKHVDANGNQVVFDMEKIWLQTPSCGTVCCIAGAALQFYNNARALAKEDGYGDIFIATDFGVMSTSTVDEAAALLGIDEVRARRLFEPHEFSYVDRASEIDASWAARCIRKLITTGEVDWLSTRQGEVA